METICGLENLEVQTLPTVVTIGMFDGVHLGHQAIMQTVKSVAERRNARSAVITFDRDPNEVVNPGAARACITTLRQKMAFIAAQGMDMALVVRANPQILATPAEEFVSDVVHGKLRAAEVVVGRNFAFGRDRLGTVELLRQMSPMLGFAVTVVRPVVVEGVVVSSTQVRQLIAVGDVEDARKLLGRPFVLEGQVIAGDGLGRTLGYPTANLRPADGQIVPAAGVYAVSLRGRRVGARGVANVGTRPTVGGAGFGVEAYIIGFSGDIYGERIEVAFLQRLRGEIQFPDTDSLVRQIERDVKLAATLTEDAASTS